MLNFGALRILNFGLEIMQGYAITEITNYLSVEVQNFTSVPGCRKRQLNGKTEAEGADEMFGVYPMILYRSA